VKYLVTSGGTEEPLDGVRYVTNFSTGRTGAALADFLTRCGHDVILIHGYHALLPDMTDLAKHAPGRLHTLRYRTFSDLERELKAMLGGDEGIEAVIHLAAVSDYSPVSFSVDGNTVREIDTQSKFSSEPEFIQVTFRRNPKIIASIRAYASFRPLVLVGFKLTKGADAAAAEAAVRRVFAGASCDLVVHNDLDAVGEGDVHEAAIYRADGTLMERVTSRELLCRHLERFTVALAQELLRKESP
jgi:phosphopantothenoylcysteine synthetase/decarboxylase